MDNKKTNLRNQIDLIDDQISNLLIERFALVKEIGAFKRENNLPLTDKNREEEVLSKATKNAETNAEKDAILAVYKTIIKECTNLQK